MKLNQLFFLVILFVLFLLIGCSSCSSNNSCNLTGVSDSLREQAIHELRQNLHTQSKWVKVHAAEYLIWLGYSEEAHEAFMEEQRKYGDESPYRIGIWRVLVQSTPDPKKKKKWINKIVEAFNNTAGTDRVHAAETLAKLNVSLQKAAPETTQKILEGEKGSLFIYTLWGASISPGDSLLKNRKVLLDFLASRQDNELFRLQAAYALRHLGNLSAKEWSRLVKIAMSESDSSKVKTSLLSAALIISPVDSVQTKTYLNIRKKLLRAINSPQKADRMEMLAALAEKGGTEDLPVLISLFSGSNSINSNLTKENKTKSNNLQNPDVRDAAAYAILKIADKKNETIVK